MIIEKKLLKDKIKPYIAILLTWFIIVIISSLAQGSILAFLSIPVSIVFLMVWLIKLIRKKTSLKDVLIKLSIIAVSYIIIGGIQFIRYKDARNNANQAVEKIYEFKSKYGKYPQKLSEIGVEERKIGSGKLFYTNEKEELTLFYPATQIPFDTYDYNFKEKVWEYRSE